MTYKVYLYNIPKVSEDKKLAIPIPDSMVKEFSDVGNAKMFAEEYKDIYDRIALIQELNNEQKMILSYSVD